jgi:hypothetical protein
MNEQLWGQLTFEQRCRFFSFNFPFDYRVNNKTFTVAAKKNWNEFKEQERQFLSFRSIPADLCS